MTFTEMLNKNVRVGYMEPWEGSDANGFERLVSVEVRMLARDAVAYYRHNLGKIKPKIAMELTDLELLQEFMAAHWAYVIEEGL